MTAADPLVTGAVYPLVDADAMPFKEFLNPAPRSEILNSVRAMIAGSSHRDDVLDEAAGVIRDSDGVPVAQLVLIDSASGKEI